MISRRRFLAHSLSITAAGALAGMSRAWCSLEAFQTAPPTAASNDRLIGRLAFVGEGAAPLDTPFGTGLDGRQYADLSSLRPQISVMQNDRFYVRTRYPDLLKPRTSWTIAVKGHVRTPKTIAAAELLQLESPAGTHLMECAGNGAFAQFGMLSAASWTGVPVAKVLKTIALFPQARRILISGFDEHSAGSQNSTPGASWSFSFEELERSRAFLATGMNGAPLPPDHGFPVRLIVPGWYGCAAVKWVDEIVLTDDEAPATAQMKEFASRTHQNGIPELAKDFAPAVIDVAAMPIRVEQWLIDGRRRFRIVGLIWGGERMPKTIMLDVSRQAPLRIAVPEAPSEAPWRIWSCDWSPPAVGRYNMSARVEEPGIRARRLDEGFYTRTVQIDSI